MKQVWKNIAKLVEPGQKVGVAVSGGADSVFLLYAFLTCPQIKRSQIVVVNVEHGIRGVSSLDDSRFVADIASREGLELAFFAVSVPTRRKISGLSEETEARLARREVFNNLLESGKVDLIATAHHEGDNIESILMHAFRGCGTNGLIGMQMKSGKFIRPLLNTSRSKIENYLKNNGIDFVTDQTNFDTAYTRNFIRHELIPKISERYDLVSAITQLSKSAKADEDFICSLVDESKFNLISPSEIAISREVFALPEALVTRYLMLAAEKIGRRIDFESKHITDIIKLSKLENGKSINLVKNLVAVNEYDNLTLYVKGERINGEVIDFSLGINAYGDGFIEASLTDSKLQSGKLIADLDKIPEGSVIRSRREGDKFTPFGLNGGKKLKDYLIDKKIPARNRDKLPLLCYNNKVLAIFGVEIADEIKLTDTTVNAVELKYTES